MSPDAICVIINPASAGGRGGKVAPRILAALDRAGMVYDALYTDSPGHAARLARTAAQDGAKRVLIVGGDGTIHEVASGLLDSRVDPLPSIAVLPVGTGNDFYRMVGAGKSIADVVRLLESGLVEHFDVGRVRWATGERIFVNLLGLGVDVEVLKRRARFTRLKGLVQYLAALLSAIVSFKAPAVEIEIEDTHLTGPTTLSAITVGPSVGGGFMLAPGATPSDGKLDLCHISGLGLLQILRLIPKVMRGTHGSSEVVTMRRFERAVLRSPGGEPLWFELDGELVPEPAHELDVGILPGVLPVIVPARA